MKKSLDVKLANIHANPHTAKDFIIADAKDADMAFGITAPGPQGDPQQGCWKTLEDYRQQIRQVIDQGLVDCVLLSASNLEQLGIKEKLFAGTSITPAARANDTTDIWLPRGSTYAQQPSRSFRTASLDHIKYGRPAESNDEPFCGADLGLYSITFTNQLDNDYKALEDFKAFRLEAEKKHFRYFLEVFNPNVSPGMPDEQLSHFVNDCIIRTLAGVTESQRPVFLKIAYNGPRALEELASYDPNMVVGILGGSSGTTLDAFQLIHDAKKYGARVALFGRKINLSESPLDFIVNLHQIANDQIEPKEAVKAYHDALSKNNIAPSRSLNDDLELTSIQYHYS